MKTVPQNTTLVKELLRQLNECQRAFSQERVFVRGVMLALGEALTFGQHHMTDVLRAVRLTEEDWTAWYRILSKKGRFKEAEAGAALVQMTRELHGEGQPYVVGIDATTVPRTSYRMEGSSWHKCPRNPAWKIGIHRAQRFLNLSWLAPLEEGYSRSIPLRFTPAFPEKAKRGLTPATLEHQAGAEALTWVQGQLGEDGPALLALADGSYDKPDFWLKLPPNSSALVRTAKNRVLKYLPTPLTGRGRPRKYGERAPAPQDYLSQRTEWTYHNVTVRGKHRRMLARVEGPFLREKMSDFPLMLICVRGQSWKKTGKNKRRDPVFYLVNAVLGDGGWQLPYPLDRLLSWAWQRWELEVVHREVKTSFGLGDKQCSNPRAAVSSVQWSAWVYSLLSLSAYRVHGASHRPKRSATWERHPRRLTIQTVLDDARRELTTAAEFSWLYLSSPSTWTKFEANLLSLLHSPSPHPLF